MAGLGHPSRPAYIAAMAELDPGSAGTVTTIKWRFPTVHPEGHKYVAIAAISSLVCAFMAWETLAWPLLGVTIWVATFFRDPIRTVPQGENLIVAPADGLITLIQQVPPPREMAGDAGLGSEPMTRVSIFMSVFDVHINRTPIAGTIKSVVYVPGKFLNADLDKASEDNERQHILVERGDGSRVGFTQIAGLVARRIVPFVKNGDMVVAGQRIGLIRFGSRVDVYLPAGAAPRVSLGQRTISGETILGVIGDADAAKGRAL
ncbi:Phosphatidylserine decarboxylase proenzyme [Sphingomonas antarctica]